MSKAQKWAAVILCVCFVVVSVFSFVVIVSHADHECSGEHCEICLQINHLQNTLKQFGTAVAASAVALVAVYTVIAIANTHILRHSGTLIALKIQMNN